MPKILDRAVSKIRSSGSAVNPWAAAVASQQKAGNLKAGTLEPTRQGVARGQMTEAARQATPPKQTFRKVKESAVGKDLAGMAKK
jgi:hypothetical protein